MTARLCEGCGRSLRKSPGPYGPVYARKLAGSSLERRTRLPGPRLPPGLSQRLTAPNTSPLTGQVEIPIQLTLGDT